MQVYNYLDTSSSHSNILVLWLEDRQIRLSPFKIGRLEKNILLCNYFM